MNLRVLGLCLLVSGCATVSAPVTDRSSSSSTDAPVTTASSAASKRTGGNVHIVRSGDTLFSIAWAAGVDYRALGRWNGIRSPYVIRPGQRIKLTPPARSPSKNTAPPVPADTAAAKPKSQATTSSVSKSGWIWPVEGPILAKFSTRSGRKGIDIGGANGRGVRAAAGGRVVYAGSGLRGYGKLIIVKHDEVYLSAYAHNSKLLVQDGTSVKKGQQIALMGDTGTDRVKLHFEIRRRGKPVDPLKFLPKRP